MGICGRRGPFHWRRRLGGNLARPQGRRWSPVPSICTDSHWNSSVSRPYIFGLSGADSRGTEPVHPRAPRAPALLCISVLRCPATPSRSSCCPRWTWPTARRCGWSKVRPGRDEVWYAARHRAGLAGRWGAVGPPGRPRCRVRPRLEPRTDRRGGRQARRRCRSVGRDP